MGNPFLNLRKLKSGPKLRHIRSPYGAWESQGYVGTVAWAGMWVGLSYSVEACSPKRVWGGFGYLGDWGCQKGWGIIDCSCQMDL